MEVRVPNWLTASSQLKANTFFVSIVWLLSSSSSSPPPVPPLFKEFLTAQEAAVAFCLT